MLKGTKSISLNYSSVIQANGQEVTAVYMNGQITKDGRSTSTKTIQNQEAYEANKEECRADMAAFDQMMYEMEDTQGAERNED